MPEGTRKNCRNSARQSSQTIRP